MSLLKKKKLIVMGSSILGIGVITAIAGGVYYANSIATITFADFDNPNKQIVIKKYRKGTTLDQKFINSLKKDASIRKYLEEIYNQQGKDYNIKFDISKFANTYENAFEKDLNGFYKTIKNSSNTILLKFGPVDYFNAKLSFNFNGLNQYSQEEIEDSANSKGLKTRIKNHILQRLSNSQLANIEDFAKWDGFKLKIENKSSKNFLNFAQDENYGSKRDKNNNDEWKWFDPNKLYSALGISNQIDFFDTNFSLDHINSSGEFVNNNGSFQAQLEVNFDIKNYVSSHRNKIEFTDGKATNNENAIYPLANPSGNISYEKLNDLFVSNNKNTIVNEKKLTHKWTLVYFDAEKGNKFNDAKSNEKALNGDELKGEFWRTYDFCEWNDQGTKNSDFDIAKINDRLAYASKHKFYLIYQAGNDNNANTEGNNNEAIKFKVKSENGTQELFIKWSDILNGDKNTVANLLKANKPSDFAEKKYWNEKEQTSDKESFTFEDDDQIKKLAEKIITWIKSGNEIDYDLTLSWIDIKKWKFRLINANDLNKTFNGDYDARAKVNFDDFWENFQSKIPSLGANILDYYKALKELFDDSNPTNDPARYKLKSSIEKEIKEYIQKSFKDANFREIENLQNIEITNIKVNNNNYEVSINYYVKQDGQNAAYIKNDNGQIISSKNDEYNIDKNHGYQAYSHDELKGIVQGFNKDSQITGNFYYLTKEEDATGEMLNLNDADISKTRKFKLLKSGPEKIDYRKSFNSLNSFILPNNAKEKIKELKNKGYLTDNYLENIFNTIKAEKIAIYYQIPDTFGFDSFLDWISTNKNNLKAENEITIPTKVIIKEQLWSKANDLTKKIAEIDLNDLKVEFWNLKLTQESKEKIRQILQTKITEFFKTYYKTDETNKELGDFNYYQSITREIIEKLISLIESELAPKTNIKQDTTFEINLDENLNNTIVNEIAEKANSFVKEENRVKTKLVLNDSDLLIEKEDIAKYLLRKYQCPEDLDTEDKINAFLNKKLVDLLDRRRKARGFTDGEVCRFRITLGDISDEFVEKYSNNYLKKEGNSFTVGNSNIFLKVFKSDNNPNASAADLTKYDLYTYVLEKKNDAIRKFILLAYENNVARINKKLVNFTSLIEDKFKDLIKENEVIEDVNLPWNNNIYQDQTPFYNSEADFYSSKTFSLMLRNTTNSEYRICNITQDDQGNFKALKANDSETTFDLSKYASADDIQYSLIGMNNNLNKLSNLSVLKLNSFLADIKDLQKNFVWQYFKTKDNKSILKISFVGNDVANEKTLLKTIEVEIKDKTRLVEYFDDINAKNNGSKYIRTNFARISIENWLESSPDNTDGKDFSKLIINLMLKKENNVITDILQIKELKDKAEVEEPKGFKEDEVNQTSINTNGKEAQDLANLFRFSWERITYLLQDSKENKDSFVKKMFKQNGTNINKWIKVVDFQEKIANPSAPVTGKWYEFDYKYNDSTNNDKLKNNLSNQTDINIVAQTIIDGKQFEENATSLNDLKIFDINKNINSKYLVNLLIKDDKYCVEVFEFASGSKALTINEPSETSKTELSLTLKARLYTNVNVNKVNGKTQDHFFFYKNQILIMTSDFESKDLHKLENNEVSLKLLTIPLNEEQKTDSMGTVDYLNI